MLPDEPTPCGKSAATSDDGDGWGTSPERVVEPFADIEDTVILRDAFESLAPKWQDLLWRIDVEDEPYSQLATRYRTSPRGVAMLALRARRALGTAYLAEHLAAEPVQGEVRRECRQARAQLARLVRESARGRRHRKLESHLADCDGCREARMSSRD